MPADSFFEKLKRGMGIEIPAEEETEEKIKERKVKAEKAKKIEMEIRPIEPEIKKEEKRETKEEVEIKKPFFAKATEGKEKWLEPEGQLAVDVYQTELDLVIQSAIAGVKPEDLDISIEGDLVTINGERKKPIEEEGDYFSQECYWGRFSRQIILPVETDPNRVEAILKEGILIIRIPKISRERKRKILVKG